jgi:hypothetical protein
MALRRYYDDALVRYNLACYWCVMGRIKEAREMLETACQKDESLRELAETDEDLLGSKEPGVAAWVKRALEEAFYPRVEAMVLRS